MSNTWLKIKMWTKVVVFGLIALFVIIVLAQNWNERVKVHLLSREYDWSLLLVLFLTCIFSIFGWWLIKTAFKTIRQFRDMRRRGQIAKLEKEHADMLAKAAKLQTKPAEEAGE